MTRSITIYAVNLTRGMVVTEAGETGIIDMMLDGDGDLTTDPTEAVVAIARMRDGGWCSINLSQFEPRKLH